MVSIFRADPNNVGDWWSLPARYFPFKSGQAYDIRDTSLDLSQHQLVVLGGGGLGAGYFQQHLTRLSATDRSYALVAWGVGVDIYNNMWVKPLSALPRDRLPNLFGQYFDAFDDVGIRVYDAQDQRFRWVPCASCMHPALDTFRRRAPTKRIGVYNHADMPLQIDGLAIDGTADNSGNDIKSKLAFMADHEFIVTNSYHGVYWATLLNRKALCIPAKSGMYTFKHQPAYMANETLTDAHLQMACQYPDALEECRQANRAFFKDLQTKYPSL